MADSNQELFSFIKPEDAFGSPSPYGDGGAIQDSAPLAFRMRPRDLSEIAGQKHLLYKGSLLERAITSDRLSSLIFFGPPGCGKTTLAEVIAVVTKRPFCRLSAVTSSVKDVRDVVDFSNSRRRSRQSGAVLFLDEIHRFNKAQQDVLLPHVENGALILIGATTENPYFALNNALLSRSRVFQLKPLEAEDIKVVLERAWHDEERGLGKMPLTITPEAEDFIAARCEGDARVALNALELAAMTTAPDAAGNITVTLTDAEASLQKKVLLYDRDGDGHYDTISAFIKSMRGSDPDAALYWLAKMLQAGEDPRFIARRMVIFASEDVGCADYLALPLAMAAYQAAERIGMPEVRINLGHVVTYLACCPKSNAAYMGLEAAWKDVAENLTMEVPDHLKDAHYKGAKALGHGEGYAYSHDFEGHFSAEQEYMPLEKTYYHPTKLGAEERIYERLSNWREKRRAARESAGGEESADKGKKKL
ncbi:replication-associated recombination protein A [bacterium]|nr:replication-associated recombination protein A [bacterium]